MSDSNYLVLQPVAGSYRFLGLAIGADTPEEALAHVQATTPGEYVVTPWDPTVFQIELTPTVSVVENPTLPVPEEETQPPSTPEDPEPEEEPDAEPDPEPDDAPAEDEPEPESEP